MTFDNSEWQVAGITDVKIKTGKLLLTTSVAFGVAQCLFAALMTVRHKLAIVWSEVKKPLSLSYIHTIVTSANDVVTHRIFFQWRANGVPKPGWSRRGGVLGEAAATPSQPARGSGERYKPPSGSGAKPQCK